MGRVLVAYYSRTGMTKKMAEYVAEGVCFSRNDVVVRRISELKSADDIAGYDGYIFGCPTYHRDMTENFKNFLFLAQSAGLSGKLGGSFGSSTHSGEAPVVIFDTMEFVFKMKMTELGPFRLDEDAVTTEEGARACQSYGRALGRALGG